MAPVPPATATYAIAWIATLPHERAAALEMLDEEYRRPKDFEKNASDGNSYSWGRIGDHNIVIASMPDGVYGTTAAATTAARLVSSLPHVRIGLLVGTGGGVTGETRDSKGQITFKHDVLLGDVVVSRPENGKGGVVLYDVKKAKVVDGKKVTTLNGQLNQPTDALLNALGALRAQHLRRPSRMEELLCAFQQNEIMKDTFVYPGEELDPVRVELRSSTNEKVRHVPKIRYGTIACGDTLIKDGAERDAIVTWLRDNDVDPICFEMEAGGLMNNFPCIVVRGICNYSDERKNDTWQNYAAATAAAFAKELLDYVDTDEIEEEVTLGARLEDSKSEIHNVKNDTSHLISNALLEDQANYHDGTAAWCFENDHYRSWTAPGKGDVLFCAGHPGTGKSTLASRVIEVLQRSHTSHEGIPVPYMFFNHKMQATQNADHLKKNDGRLTLEQTHSVVESIISNLDDHFVILDALDEAHPCVCDDLIPQLCSLTHKYKLHLLATSRLIPAIQKAFALSPSVAISASETDVEAYVRRRAMDFRDDKLRASDLIADTVAAVSARCRGMFLLARLLMDILVARVATWGALKHALQSLPSGEIAYKPAYDSRLERVTSQQGDFKRLGLECLAWVVFAKRSLTPAELGQAPAITSGGDRFDPDFVPNLDLLPSICAGLVNINYQSSAVSLVHYTAHEYLVDIRAKWFPNADFLLADSCLKYMQSESGNFGPSALIKKFQIHIGDVIDPERFDRMKDQAPARLFGQWPFMRYAAFTWSDHAQDMESNARNDEEQIRRLSLRFAQTSATQTACAWMGLATSRLRPECEGPNGLLPMAKLAQFTVWHAVAVWDLARVCKTLVTMVAYSNSRFSGRTPLILAAQRGSSATAQVLLDLTCAQADEVDGQAAEADSKASKGRSDVDEMQCEVDGLDIEAQEVDSEAQEVDSDPWDSDLSFREHAASYGPSESADEHDSEGWSDENSSRSSVLWHAARYGHAAFVGLLCKAAPSLDCNFVGQWMVTPLLAATQSGYYEVVDMLLKEPKVDVNYQRVDGATALIEASRAGHEDIVLLLLSRPDVDSNKHDRRGRTALMSAAHAGHDEVVRRLLTRRDINVRHCDDLGENALSLAATDGHTGIVRQLLATGELQVDGPDGNGRTPFAHAAANACIDVIDLLVASGANVATRRSDGVLQLFELAIVCKAELVADLLNHLPDPDSIVLTQGDERFLCTAYTKARLMQDRASSVTSPSRFFWFRGSHAKYDTTGICQGVLPLRRIPAVGRLTDTVDNTLAKVIEAHDRAMLAMCFAQVKVSGRWSLNMTCGMRCDCTMPSSCYLGSGSDALWICSHCEERQNVGLNGRAFLVNCVRQGAWCGDRRHCMKKIDLEPLFDGKPSDFVYPFPEQRYREEAWHRDQYKKILPSGSSTLSAMPEVGLRRLDRLHANSKLNQEPDDSGEVKESDDSDEEGEAKSKARDLTTWKAMRRAHEERIEEEGERENDPSESSI